MRKEDDKLFCRLLISYKE